MDKTWKKRLEGKLKEKLGPEYQIVYPDRPQKEDEKPVGIMKTGEVSGILLYLKNSVIAGLDSEEDFQKTAEGMLAEYQYKRSILISPADKNFESMKSKIVYTLENGNDPEALRHVPHTEFHGMAVIYQLCSIEGDEIHFRTITNEDMSVWKVTQEEVTEAARTNTPRLFPPVIQMLQMVEGHVMPVEMGETLEEMLEYIGSQKKVDAPMYVLTNQKSWYGSSSLLYDHLLERISDSCKDSLIILPMGIHDVILIPKKENATSITEWKALMEILNWGNKEEALSDHIYMFDRTDQMFKIAAEEKCQA